MGKKVLWVHSSCKVFDDSLSTQVGYHLFTKLREQLEANGEEIELMERDTTYLPHIDGATLTAAYSDPEEYEATLSHTLVQEVKTADYILISLPMYNFSIPSSLKAWIDHIVIKNQTFGYVDGKPSALVAHKPCVINIASGGAYAANSPYDQITKYLTMVLGFIGILHPTILWSSGTGQKPLEENFAATKEHVTPESVMKMFEL